MSDIKLGLNIICFEKILLDNQDKSREEVKHENAGNQDKQAMAKSNQVQK